MIFSEKIQYSHGGALTHGNNDCVGTESHDGSREETIPLRYRNGLGGIDLEQVRRDQLQARQQVVRAMIQRLKNLRRRH